MTNRYAFALSALSAACLASSASAHIVLETRQAAVGSYYKAVFKVGHGCDGAATTAISVQIPEGVIAAKPMPKPGWKIDLRMAAYASAHLHHGHEMSEGVRGVTWSGELPDDYYDEFVISVSLTEALKPDTTLYFPVTQSCGNATVKWDHVPESGKPAPKLPAPALKLTPKQ